MPWWTGPTVLATLDEFQVSEPPEGQPLRLPIQDVYRFDKRRILAGRVEAGSIKVGDRIVFFPHQQGQHGPVPRALETRPPPTPPAPANPSASRSPNRSLSSGGNRRARNRPALRADQIQGARFLARAAAVRRRQEIQAQARHPGGGMRAGRPRKGLRLLHPRRNFPPGERFVGRQEVGEVTLRTKKPVAFDVITEIVPTGRFVSWTASTSAAAASLSRTIIPGARTTRITRATTSTGATAR